MSSHNQHLSSRRQDASDSESTDISSENDEETSVNTTAVARRWTSDEDERLHSGIDKYGLSNWKSIAKVVGTRDHIQCLQRWQKVLRPGLIKGTWSVEEDDKLVRLVNEGFKNWGKLSNKMPGRTSKQCRERWRHHLDPRINREDFTAEEDKTILELQKRLGNRWAAIAKQLPRRTETAVRSRFRALNSRRRSEKRYQTDKISCDDQSLSSDALQEHNSSQSAQYQNQTPNCEDDARCNSSISNSRISTDSISIQPLNIQIMFTQTQVNTLRDACKVLEEVGLGILSSTKN